MRDTIVFTPEMSIQEALKLHPEVKNVLERFDMLCGDCMASPLERIQDGAKTHSVNLEDVLRELNALLK